MTDSEYERSLFIEGLYDHAYFVLREKGICQQSIDTLEYEMQQKGLSMPEAKTIVDGSIAKIHREAAMEDEYSKKVFREKIRTGIILSAIGIVATILSYLLAAPGETYIVFVGAIICGIVLIFKGIVKF